MHCYNHAGYISFNTLIMHSHTNSCTSSGYVIIITEWILMVFCSTITGFLLIFFTHASTHTLNGNKITYHSLLCKLFLINKTKAQYYMFYINTPNMSKCRRIGDHGQDKYMKYQKEQSNYILPNNTWQMIIPVNNIKSLSKQNAFYLEMQISKFILFIQKICLHLQKYS